jgi:hypothetical protein
VWDLRDGWWVVLACASAKQASLWDLRDGWWVVLACSLAKQASLWDVRDGWWVVLACSLAKQASLWDLLVVGWDATLPLRACKLGETMAVDWVSAKVPCMVSWRDVCTVSRMGICEVSKKDACEVSRKVFGVAYARAWRKEVLLESSPGPWWGAG